MASNKIHVNSLSIKRSDKEIRQSGGDAVSWYNSATCPKEIPVFLQTLFFA